MNVLGLINTSFKISETDVFLSPLDERFLSPHLLSIFGHTDGVKSGGKGVNVVSRTVRNLTTRGKH